MGSGKPLELIERAGLVCYRFNEAGARGLRKTQREKAIASAVVRFNEAGARGLRKTR